MENNQILQSEKERNTGRLTPSGFKKLMTSGRGKDKELGDTAIKYIMSIILERLGVEKRELWTPALQWGIDNEPGAVIAYETATGQMVQPCGHEVHTDFPFVGGTPDGLIGDEGIIEIKCPDVSENHFGNIVSGLQISDYYDQMQGYLWITGRQWCDFVSFDPRFPGGLKLNVQRVERDEARIAEIQTRCLLAESMIQTWFVNLKAKYPNIELPAHPLCWAGQ